MLYPLVIEERGRPDQTPDVLRNVREALDLGLPYLEASEFHGKELIVAAGGPSLAAQLDTLRELREGRTLWAINDTHDFLLEHDITPDGAVFIEVMDAAPAYIEHPHPDVTYLWASHCHTDNIRRLAENGGNVVLWNCKTGHGEEDVLPDDHVMIHGGAMTASRSINVGLACGYRSFHLFGFDCSFRSDGQSHAYYHRVDPNNPVLDVHFQGKEYISTVAFVQKARDLIKMFLKFGHLFNVEVYGDGLFPAMFRAEFKPEGV